MNIQSQIVPKPRTLAHVLLDLTQAHEDSQTALNDYLNAPLGSEELRDADDRRTEADQRVDELRDEFRTAFREAVGLTWKQVETAIQEAVL